MEMQTDRRSRLLKILGATTALAGMAWPMLAAAQESAPAAAGDTSSGLTEIVVTATHKTESVQKVAISMLAIDPAKLEQHQVVSFADFANMLPSVSFSTLGPGRSQPFFRGITASGGAASTVGTYLNEIPITTAGRLPEVHIYDVERLEALSGPQGTLFGSSSMAGTIRIITNKAKLGVVEGGIDVQANKYGKGNAGGMIEGFINLPVTDKIAVRLVGFYRHDGGYINNPYATLTYQYTGYTTNNAAVAGKNYNPVDEYGTRATATIQASDDWTITPEFTYQYLDAKGSFNFDPRIGDLAVHDFRPTYDKDGWYQAALTVHGKIGDFDLVSATGYFNRKIRNASDYTYYSVTYDNLAKKDPVDYGVYSKFLDKNGNVIDPTQQYNSLIHQQKFTQEVRLSVPKSWPFDLTVGGFYQFQKAENNGDYYIQGLGQATGTGAWTGFSPAINTTLNPDVLYLVETDQHYKDGAAFAEGSINILSNLKATGGVRYYVSDNGTVGFGGEWKQARKAGCWNSDPTVIYGKFEGNPRLTCINTNTTFHQTGETHKLSLTWQAASDKMLYVTYSTGFRPGGGNRTPRPNYQADTLDNFEFGFKTRWGNNFRFNGAIYYEKWNNMQFGVVVPNTQGSTLTLNAGAARVYGTELDAEWRLGKLVLSASGAYNDAALSKDICNLDANNNYYTQLASCPNSADVAAPKGTRLPRQPRLKLQTTARYNFQVSGLESFVQGTMFYQTSSTSDVIALNDSLLGDTAGFASFDFSAGIKKDKWTAEAFIQNAFDERGILSKNTFCSIQLCANSSRSYPIKPQFFGIKLGYKY
ncbi:TonB-dependent receptor [Novosphingobium sp. Fuku2-ISO-50]|uniref:TonB-dependent receptor n=1 Tax=Novosphingobium sp. Fuku2-ISO-50 TaxID=1739114 RepID=UPI000B32DFC2|nr:TonB-dependent receptor [Novosphingobium sp. Fuku2-ISO-50]